MRPSLFLRQLAASHRKLAELKGVARTIPNETILISTLTLQEAFDSSAVENIITTRDELYQAELFAEKLGTPAAKEVQLYARALRSGFDLVRGDRILTDGHIVQIQGELERNSAGFRRVPGTNLKELDSGTVIYTPPQDFDTISKLMRNLSDFINNEELSDLDHLVKLAVIHHQFESIHPFYDGNGRTGRIINILYLVIKDLLDLPILYLSRYIIRNKSDYYKLLQAVRDHGDWEQWILFILKGIEVTSIQTIDLINGIRDLMMTCKASLRRELPKIYSQDLLNSLFRHPYTKIEFVQSELGVTRKTASRYLNLLEADGYLKKLKIGRSTFYFNEPLLNLLSAGGSR